MCGGELSVGLGFGKIEEEKGSLARGSLGSLSNGFMTLCVNHTPLKGLYPSLFVK